MPNLMKIGIISGLGAVVLLIIFSVFVKIVTIQGNELGVHETWANGVDPTPVTPGTHVYWLGFMHRVVPYNMASHIYVMNNKPMKEEYKKAGGRESDIYRIPSSEGQELAVSMNVRWRLDPSKIIDLHTRVREDFEEKCLRPYLLRVVKDKATVKSAIEAYSGVGLVDLQKSIDEQLRMPDSELTRQGLIIENFVIEGIELDTEYVKEIRQKQVAVQRDLRIKQEEIAALSEAKKAKAEAQADLNRKVVEAQRDKEVGVLNAQKLGEQQVIAAKADKEKVVLAAQGEKESSELRAAAILAIGKAEADAKKLQLLAYSGEGADTFAKIEISKNMSNAFKNIQGYLPSDMNINLLSASFMDSVNQLMSNPVKEAKK